MHSPKAYEFPMEINRIELQELLYQFKDVHIGRQIS